MTEVPALATSISDVERRKNKNNPSVSEQVAEAVSESDSLHGLQRDQVYWEHDSRGASEAGEELRNLI